MHYRLLSTLWRDDELADKTQAKIADKLAVAINGEAPTANAPEVESRPIRTRAR